ncbi:uncharacterized protein MONOS_3399 [Monocercomonoides exilis]|uniref:uncharacterized protein n=1 Tax=Monocercomonoides exilis TaxID=2049356 RepID=UPI00355AC02D|nr:hypothetical protein MONOS_3399 [Monocercomonoides exilis]|eukprot:MONOS_3399.1-p1 / transcript=MONOS_3399.1 / gene=MONOS_3399 / organism=Monocercomonoides_exilis_PA203 / gene_product=unspecified product / transcript_product=unspecified product / location=Mono_scaffold00080:11232-18664(+) / protein_length=2390 / sequence_SO=supercontig / SO=protein_coding / is_pseudo=false
MALSIFYTLLLVAYPLIGFNIHLTVDPNGKDKDECWADGADPCKTIAYALKNTVESVELTINAGIFTEESEVTVLKGNDLMIKGQLKQSVLNARVPQQNALFVVKESKMVEFNSFTISTNTHGGIIIESKCDTVTFNEVLFTNGGDATNWFLPISVDDSQKITLNLHTASELSIPTTYSRLPYFIELHDTDTVNINGKVDENTIAEFTYKQIGLAAITNCKTVSIKDISFNTHAGNKILLDKGSLITLNNLQFNVNPKTHSFNSDSLLDEIEKEMSRNQVYYNSLNNVDPVYIDASPVYTPSAVFVSGSDDITIGNCKFQQLHSMGVVIDSVQKCTITGSTFSHNVMGYSPSALFEKRIVDGAEDKFGGCGCSLTITGVSDTLKLDDLTFSDNSLTYENWGSMSKSNGVEFDRRLKSISNDFTATTRNFAMDIVSADLWISHVSGNNDATMNKIKLEQENMAYDATMFDDNSKAEHFIVPDFAESAPTVVNMMHAVSVRPSTVLFVMDVQCALKITDLQISASQGTAAVFFSTVDLDWNQGSVKNMKTQPNVFCESAILIASEKDNTKIALHGITSTDIKPSKASHSVRTSSVYGDDGWKLPEGGAFVLHPSTAYHSITGGESSGAVLTVKGVDSLTVEGLTCEKAESNGHGGAVAIFDTKTVSFTTLAITDCKSKGNGGGLAILDDKLESLSFNGLTITKCSSGMNGGAVYLPLLKNANDVNVVVTFTGKSTITDCSGSEGGGLFIGSQDGTKADKVSKTNFEVAKSTFTLKATNLEISKCTASYGGGLYLGSIQHQCKISLDDVNVHDCKAFVAGGGMLVSALVQIVPSKALSNDAVDYLTIKGSKFISNEASGMGGGLFAHIIPFTVKLDNSANEDQWPSVYITETTFTDNKCFGALHDVSHGLSGGGGMAIMFCENHRSASNAETYNTRITGCTFSQNIGGAFCALEAVVAQLRENTFQSNKNQIGHATVQTNLNIECFKSKLNIAKTNHFFSDEQEEDAKYMYYACDSTCEAFGVSEMKCTVEPKVEPTPDVKKLPIASYPDVPKIVFEFDSLVLSHPIIMASTSGTVKPPIDPDMMQNFEFQDAPSQIIDAVAERVEGNPSKVRISSVADTVTLNGFPQEPPKSLFFYVTADGYHWTKPADLKLEDDRQKVTVDPEGEDNDECMNGESNCKTISYVISKRATEVVITINNGMFSEADSVKINQGKYVDIKGQKRESTITAENGDEPVFVLNGVERFLFQSLCVVTEKRGGLIFTGQSTNIKIIDVLFENMLATPATWYTPISITDASNVYIRLDSTSTFNADEYEQKLPYMIECRNTKTLEITGSDNGSPKVDFGFKAVSLASLINCEDVQIHDIAFSTHVGNKIFVKEGKNYKITNIEFNSNAQLTNADGLSILSEVENEAKKALKPSSQFADDDTVYTPAAVYVAGIDILSVKSCVFDHLHSMGLVVERIGECTLEDLKFEHNVMGLAPSFMAAKRTHNNVLNTFGGCGCSLTAVEITKKFTVNNLNFADNSLSYENWALVDFDNSNNEESNWFRSQGTTAYPFTAVIRNYASDTVSADFWMSHVCEDSSLTKVLFTNNRMSYESFMYETSSLKDHFIVPEFAFLAPTISNLMHSVDITPSANLFYLGTEGVITVKQLEVRNSEGTAAAFINVKNLILEDFTADTLKTQPNVFCESALLVSSNEEIQSRVTLSNCHVNGVYPARVSIGRKTGTKYGDDGWSFENNGKEAIHPTYAMNSMNGGESSGGFATFIGINKLFIQQGTVQKVDSNGNGGAFAVFGSDSVNVDSISISECNCEGNGGAFAILSPAMTKATFTGIKVSNCHAKGNGGGLYVPLMNEHDATSTEISLSNDCTFDLCSACEGGAIYVATKDGTVFNPKPENAIPTTIVSTLTVKLLGGVISHCTAAYGGGLYVGSLQHKNTLHMRSVSVSDCKSFITGGGLFFSGLLKLTDVVAENDDPEVEQYFYLESTTFTNNEASSIGGGAFAHVVPVTQQKALRNADELPTVYVKSGKFENNKCYGSLYDLVHGAAGGGGFAEMVCEKHNAQSNEATKYNTKIEGTLFDSNVGGGFSAIEGVAAILKDNTFKKNKNEAQHTYPSPLNIECYKSKLNIDESNKFIGSDDKEGSDYSYYSCDGECEGFTETKYMCTKHDKTKIKKSSSMADLNKNTYPELPSAIFIMESLEISHPLILISTSEDVTPPQDKDVIDAMLQRNSIIRQMKLSSRGRVALMSKRKSSFISLNSSMNENEDLPPMQLEESRAYRSKTEVSLEVFVQTLKSKIVLEGFPKEAPSSLWFFATADGVHWTAPISVDLLNILSEEDSQKWGWISFGILISFILIFVLLVGLLKLITYFVEKRRNRGYIDIEKNYTQRALGGDNKMV